MSESECIVRLVGFSPNLKGIGPRLLLSWEGVLRFHHIVDIKSLEGKFALRPLQIKHFLDHPVQWGV